MIVENVPQKVYSSVLLKGFNGFDQVGLFYILQNLARKPDMIDFSPINLQIDLF